MRSFASGLKLEPLADQRGVARDEVFYRTRGTTPHGAIVQLQVVNISACGFMARTEADLEVGDTVTVRLPAVGAVLAEVRWSLGGRIGCQFDSMIGLAPYLELLSEMVGATR